MTGRSRLFAGLLALAFAPALWALAGVWTTNDSYSHGFLVPLLSLSAAWNTVPKLRQGQANPRGAALLILALLAYGPGLLSGSPSLQGLALVLAVAGFALWEWGSEGLRRLAFPVGYLAFMVPLPEPILVPLILKLQLWVSGTAVSLLHAGGVTILREGNVMELPTGDQLFVAEACSGITSLVTLIPLAVALAYFAHRGLKARWTIVLAAIPLALFFNLLRVLGTVLAVVNGAGDMVTSGPLHDFAGLITFALACLALVAISGAIRPKGKTVPATPIGA